MGEKGQLIAAIYKNAGEAEDSLEELRDLNARGNIHLKDAVILSKSRGGETSIEEITDLDSKEGRNVGALIGAIIGLALGPGGGAVGTAIGGVLGLAAGAVTGSVVAGAYDSSTSNKLLEQIAESLPNTTSAILVVVPKVDRDETIAALDAYQADLYEWDIDLGTMKPIEQ